MRTFQVLLSLLCVFGFSSAVVAQNPFGMLDSLPTLKDYKAMRSSSSDPDWKNGNGDCRPIPAGETLTLAELEGPGRIVHIWFTIASNEANYGKKLVLKTYWDNEPTPSVEAPINDFFSQGHGMDLKVNSLPFRVTSSGRARNCYFPMPFGRSAKIQVTNEGKEPVNAFFWYIDWQKLDSLPEDTAYFHAKYRQEYPCKSGEDYLILDAAGRGHFVGCNLNVRYREDPGWWGEGDDRFYIDGETEPSLKGTGSEDYLCDAWGIGQMDGLFYGCTLMEGWEIGDKTSAYRFHIPDPIPFAKSLKMTIEHKGTKVMPDGKWDGYQERADDFSSVAYWYQVEPHVEFYQMPPVEERLYTSTVIQIEGESMVPTAQADGAQPAVQDLTGWSGGKHLFFMSQDSSAWLQVKFPVEKEGTYVVRLRPTKAPDYGNYSISLDGGDPALTMSLYSPSVVTGQFISLGRHRLSQGEHSLKFQCVGADSASTGHYFGLDVIELLPVK